MSRLKEGNSVLMKGGAGGETSKEKDQEMEGRFNQLEEKNEHLTAEDGEEEEDIHPFI